MPACGFVYFPPMAVFSAASVDASVSLSDTLAKKSIISLTLLITESTSGSDASPMMASMSLTRCASAVSS